MGGGGVGGVSCRIRRECHCVIISLFTVVALLICCLPHECRVHRKLLHCQHITTSNEKSQKFKNIYSQSNRLTSLNILFHYLSVSTQCIHNSHQIVFIAPSELKWLYINDNRGCNDHLQFVVGFWAAVGSDTSSRRFHGVHIFTAIGLADGCDLRLNATVDLHAHGTLWSIPAGGTIRE